MIISKTPFRVSLFGGGTDYPEFYEKHGGAVLGMAINKYCYISIRYLPPNFNHNYRIAYSDLQYCNTIDQIRHPVIRQCLQDYGETKGVEVMHQSDLPAHRGLGSSSAFTVGFLNAYKFLSISGQQYSRLDLARFAIEVERHQLNEAGGEQDQLLCALGGINFIEFKPYSCTSIPYCELGKYMLLFDTKTHRFAPDVASKLKAGIDGIANNRRLHEMKRIAYEGRKLLESKDYIGLGKLLHLYWMIHKRFLPGVSNEYIMGIYETGIKAGALGGKLIGAGNGGYMLFIVEPEKQDRVIYALKGLHCVKFDIDLLGTNIIYSDVN